MRTLAITGPERRTGLQRGDLLLPAAPRSLARARPPSRRERGRIAHGYPTVAVPEMRKQA